MPHPRPPHLHRERTRHGELAWYVRKDHGKRIRLRAKYGSAEFWGEYRAALEGSATTAAAPKTKPLTLAWALNKYRNNSAWAKLKPATRRQRENIFHKVIATEGDTLLSDIDQDAIKDGRERRKDRPHAANNFLKAMRGFFAFCLEDKLVKIDPTKGVKLLKGNNDDIGFHTWTTEEIERFEAHWPLGSKQRLALHLCLYTGLSRGDVVQLGKQHVSNGQIAFRMEKKRGTGMVYPPLLPILAETIAATKTSDLTFLVTERGTPFVKESFGNWFREAARAAGCPGSAHGLRKAGARRAAERGATVNQLMALYGWGTEKMALHYTRDADRKLLARDAGKFLAPDQVENENRPHLGSGAGENTKLQTKTGG